MKHFLPSSVMLTPFVVKYYDETEEHEIDEETQDSTNLNSSNEEAELGSQ
ncbi:hypothetical protein [uncultured Vibrio sp.]|nr:hypothetical protein [uncultured Vibrio sp.]